MRPEWDTVRFQPARVIDVICTDGKSENYLSFFKSRALDFDLFFFGIFWGLFVVRTHLKKCIDWPNLSSGTAPGQLAHSINVLPHIHNPVSPAWKDWSKKDDFANFFGVIVKVIPNCVLGIDNMEILFFILVKYCGFHALSTNWYWI